MAATCAIAVAACGGDDSGATGSGATGAGGTAGVGGVGVGPGGAGGVGAGKGGAGPGVGGAMQAGPGGTGVGGTAAGGSMGGTGPGGAGGGPPVGGPGAIFVTPSDPATLGSGCSIDGLVPTKIDNCFSDFFDHPWPSDARAPGGKPIYAGWPNPKKNGFLGQFIGTAGDISDGFSPQGAGYVRFSEAIDPATLPTDPAAGAIAGASVQLVDVDDASPEKGTRRLVSLLFRKDEGVYYAPSTLAFLPTFGYPLRPRTRYAFVVTTAVKTATGQTLVRPPALDAVLGLGADVGGSAAVRASWAPAIATLEAGGVTKTTVAHLTVFTTSGPSEELALVRDHARKSFPAPTANPAKWAAKEQQTNYDVYEGEYGPSPDYQEGKLPFQNVGDGGGFGVTGGVPVVQRQFSLRFALVIPKAASCPVPPTGYPIVLYAHGTGGDYRSFVQDGTGDALASRCLASMGIDQIFHGTRPGAPADPTQIPLLFFNVLNPVAGRTNGRQAAIDEVQRARLFTESNTAVPAAVSHTGVDIPLDGTRLSFFGHSQGGLNGPLYLSVDDSARGGVLSGSSSVFSITLIDKTSPQPSIAGLVKGVIGLKPADYEEMSSFHPAVSLAQAIVDVLDPIHYVGAIARSPRPGFAPKSVYQTEGVNPDGTGDTYAPPHGIEAQALATGLSPMSPVVHVIPEAGWGGVTAITIPPGGLSGNLAGGKASGVLAQWQPAAGKDGHFVVFDVAAARAQAAQFLRGLADDPKGLITPPLFVLVLSAVRGWPDPGPRSRGRRATSSGVRRCEPWPTRAAASRTGCPRKRRARPPTRSLPRARSPCPGRTRGAVRARVGRRRRRSPASWRRRARPERRVARRRRRSRSAATPKRPRSRRCSHAPTRARGRARRGGAPRVDSPREPTPRTTRARAR